MKDPIKDSFTQVWYENNSNKFCKVCWEENFNNKGRENLYTIRWFKRSMK